MGKKFLVPFQDPLTKGTQNFFKKPGAPPEDPATIAARQAQVAELGKTNDQQNYLIKKLMMAQRGFRPFGAPAPVASAAFAAPGAPQNGADAPGTGSGSRLFGSVRAARTGLGNFRGGNNSGAGR